MHENHEWCNYSILGNTNSWHVVNACNEDIDSCKSFTMSLSEFILDEYSECWFQAGSNGEKVQGATRSKKKQQIATKSNAKYADVPLARSSMTPQHVSHVPRRAPQWPHNMCHMSYPLTINIPSIHHPYFIHILSRRLVYRLEHRLVYSRVQSRVPSRVTSRMQFCAQTP